MEKCQENGEKGCLHAGVERWVGCGGKSELKIIIIKLFWREQKGQEQREEQTGKRFKVAQQTLEVTG